MRRVVAAAAGVRRVLPTVAAVLAAGDGPAQHAADLVADLAGTSRPAVAHLEPLLRDRLGDRRSRLSAIRALARLGVPTAELTEALSHGITDHGALAVIEELHAVELIPALQRLLVGDERCGAGGSADDIVWADELFQELVAGTIARLVAAPGPGRRR